MSPVMGTVVKTLMVHSNLLSELQAQEDAEKLRSVVMPMEKEIAALKEKLAEAEEKIKAASEVRWSSNWILIYILQRASLMQTSQILLEIKRCIGKVFMPFLSPGAQISCLT